MNNLRLGRPLDIEALNNAKNKVTLGFKCDAQVKLELAIEAEEKGMSLSQYIESLVLQRNEKMIQIDNLYTQEELEEATNVLNDEIRFFEHPKLFEALEKYRGQEVSYTDEEGKRKTIIVRSIQDVFTIFINHINLS